MNISVLITRVDATYLFHLILIHKLIFICLFYVFALAISASTWLDNSISKHTSDLSRDEVAWYNITQDVFLHWLDRCKCLDLGENKWQ